MLYIKNYEQLKHKTILNTGWYVNNILPAVVVMDMNGTHRDIYKIEITNRKTICKVELNRKQTIHKSYVLSLGKYDIQMELNEIGDINELLKCINLLMAFSEIT